MPGFNYGGFGDGTGWSSESGGTVPGGGSTGNAGNHDSGGNGGNPSGETTAQQQQLSSIRNNAAVRQKLSNMILAARKINPYAKLTINSISKKGVMSISVTELSAEQAAQIGLGGLIMGVDASGTKLAIGELATGVYRSGENQKFDHNSTPTSVESVTSTSTPLFNYDPKSGTYTSNKYFAKAGTIQSLKITGPYTYRLLLDFAPGKVADITVNNGDPNNITVNLNNWAGPVNNTKEGIQKLIREFIAFKLAEEREMLSQAADVIVAASQGVSKTLGEKYKTVANEIAANVKNFQGKKIRNIDQAMASLNKVLVNPAIKINAADKAAIINAWNHLNATDMAYKFAYLGKAFSAADIIMKVEKARQKSIEGINTGNWKPLLLEVESWVLSGIATGFALSILASLATFLASTAGLPVTAVMIVGVIAISLAASLIDDKLVDKINNEVIRPAH